MTKRKINRAIKHLYLEVQHERGAGYCYFTGLHSGDTVGESVMVCCLKHYTLQEWLEKATDALEQGGHL